MPFTHSASIRSSIAHRPPPTTVSARGGLVKPAPHDPRGYKRRRDPQRGTPIHASPPGEFDSPHECSTARRHAAAATGPAGGPIPVVRGAQDETLEPVEVRRRTMSVQPNPQASPARLADRLEHPVPGENPRRVRLVAHEYRLVHEARSRRATHSPPGPASSCSTLSPYRDRSHREHRQAGHNRRPSRCTGRSSSRAHPQRLLSARAGAATERQQPEGDRSAVADLLHRQRPQLARPNSIRQWQAIEPRTDLLDHRPVVVGDAGNRGNARRARSSNSRTASDICSPGPVPAATVSGGTRTTASPPIPSGSRLVASIDRPGHARSRVSEKFATASTRCSQLSRISSARPSARCSTSTASGGRADQSCRPRTSVTVCHSRSGSRRSPNSTNHVPPVKTLRDSRATRSASGSCRRRRGR